MPPGGSPGLVPGLPEDLRGELKQYGSVHKPHKPVTQEDLRGELKLSGKALSNTAFFAFLRGSQRRIEGLTRYLVVGLGALGRRVKISKEN